MIGEPILILDIFVPLDPLLVSLRTDGGITLCRSVRCWRFIAVQSLEEASQLHRLVRCVSPCLNYGAHTLLITYTYLIYYLSLIHSTITSNSS